MDCSDAVQSGKRAVADARECAANGLVPLRCSFKGYSDASSAQIYCVPHGRDAPSAGDSLLPPAVRGKPGYDFKQREQHR